MSTTAASSDSLPAAAHPSASGRQESLMIKRGASVATLTLADPAAPSPLVTPAAPGAPEQTPPPKSAEQEVAEGGQLIDAMADFKETWAAK